MQFAAPTLRHPHVSICKWKLALRWSSHATRARALVYTDRGEPTEVLRGATYDLPALKLNEARVRFRYSPQNPADLNVIQGSYPEKAPPSKLIPKSADGKDHYVGGSEGFAIVEEIASKSETHLKPGDWVIMAQSQQGTWSSRSNIPISGLFPISRSSSTSPKATFSSSSSSSSSSTLTEIQAATLGINPPTAYRMLKDFESLQPGDLILQNGGNSQVGLAVIQLAKEWNLRTINFVRDRSENDMKTLREELCSLGADYVVSYSELADKNFRKTLADWTGGAHLKLGLNCVGGQDTSNMAKLLSRDATLVTYGAMSMQPLSLPSSLFIFKLLKSRGFWMSDWYKNNAHSEDRISMTEELIQLMESGKLREPKTEIVSLSGSDEEIGRLAKEAIREIKGKKVVFTFPEA